MASETAFSFCARRHLRSGLRLRGDGPEWSDASHMHGAVNDKKWVQMQCSAFFLEYRIGYLCDKVK